MGKGEGRGEEVESKRSGILHLLHQRSKQLEIASPLFATVVPVSTSATTPDARPLRKDAERNRRRILDAAGDLFAEEGLHVTLDAVADRAGVGVGTVYRRFADKDALIDALFEDRLDEVAAIAEAALQHDDAWAGLVLFLERALELHAHDRGLKELVFTTTHGRDRVATARDRIKPLVARIVDRAHASGALRADVGTTDMAVLQLMITSVMEYAGETAPDVWRRCLSVVLDGLRAAPGARTLPVPALTDDQLDATMACGLSARPRR
jgi:AcrR family transcriptional regulator